MIPSNVTRGLRVIGTFAGRDSPAQFWPYAAVVLVVTFITSFVLDAVIIALSVVLGGDSGISAVPLIILIVTAVSAIIVAAVLAAAVTRRLHDRGHSGAWAFPPLVLLLGGMGLMTPLFAAAGQTPEPPPALFLVTFGVIVLYFIALGLLVLQLALPGWSATSDLVTP